MEMASFNKVILLANLTRDPTMKILPNQTAVCEFGTATNRKFKTAGGEDREEVCFVDVTAFGRQAEVINEYCRKGDAPTSCGFHDANSTSVIGDGKDCSEALGVRWHGRG
jgi:primosomal replication protein N